MEVDQEVWVLECKLVMISNRTNNFKIADFYISIIFTESHINNMTLLSSFEPFRTNYVSGGLFFKLTIDDSISQRKANDAIGTFDTGNGNTEVYSLEDGGYQYIINNTEGKYCCLLQTNKDFSECVCALNGDTRMRAFGLNNALMLIFAFVGSLHETLLIHASAVCHNDKGFAFTGKSGTGKSTHTDLWMKYIEGTELINDDNPVLRVLGNKTYIYGSPWSGKTPCYKQKRIHLGAITQIVRAKEDKIKRMNPAESFASSLPSCASMKWDDKKYNAICDTITKIIENTPIYTLYCLPDEKSARICQRTISK